MGRKQRQANTRKSVQIKQELSRRIVLKREKKQTTERNQIDKLLKTTELNITREFPDLADSARRDLVDSLGGGEVVGRSICHVWYSHESRQKYIL